jgi:hypothetical protein
MTEAAPPTSLKTQGPPPVLAAGPPLAEAGQPPPLTRTQAQRMAAPAPQVR